jgi:hypothetical protein
MDARLTLPAWVAVLFAAAASASLAHHYHSVAPNSVPQTANCSTVIDARYPRQYVAYTTLTPPTIDGKLDEPMWTERAFTEDFVDISTTTLPRFRTRAKIAFDDEWLYVAGHVEDTAVWANITYACHCINASDDQVIFHDNDFEVFVDPSGTCWGYKEFEINAADQSWDALLDKPFTNGGYENSSRVFGKDGFDMVPPLRSGVYIDGVLNDPASKPKYWTVEIAFPLSKLVERTNVSYPPKTDDFWRINFSRVEWAVKVVNGRYEKFASCQSCPNPGAPTCDNWAWSPMQAIDMHRPEMWAFLQFSEDAVNTTAPIRNVEWPARYTAHELYYAQVAYFAEHNVYTDNVPVLVTYANFPNVISSADCNARPYVILGPGAKSYTAYIGSSQSDSEFTVSITDERYISVVYTRGG